MVYERWWLSFSDRFAEDGKICAFRLSFNLIQNRKWTFEAKARSDSKVLVFDGKNLLQYCEKDHHFGYSLMKRFAGLMSERLHAARLKMMDSWAPAGWA